MPSSTTETNRTAFIGVVLPIYGTEQHVEKTVDEFRRKVHQHFPKAKVRLDKANHDEVE